MYDNDLDIEHDFKEEHDNKNFTDPNYKDRYWYSILIYVVLFIIGFAGLFFTIIFQATGSESLYRKNPSDTSYLLDVSSLSVNHLSIVNNTAFEESYEDLKELYIPIYEFDDFIFLIHKDAVGLVTTGTDKSYGHVVSVDGVNRTYLTDEVFTNITTGQVTKWENGLEINMVVAKDHIPSFIDGKLISYFETKPLTTPLMNALVLSLSYLSVAVILFFVLKPQVMYEFNLFVKNTEKVRVVAQSFINALVIVFAFNIVSVIIASLIGNANQTSVNQLSINNMLSTPLPAVISFAAIIFLGPLVEELIFRKSLMGLIKNDKIALVVSTLVFALIHITSELIAGAGSDFLINLISYAGGGVAFGYIYLKNKRNIWIPIIVHMLYNLLSVIMIFL